MHKGSCAPGYFSTNCGFVGPSPRLRAGLVSRKIAGRQGSIISKRVPQREQRNIAI